MDTLITVKVRSDLYGLKNINIDQLVYCVRDNTTYHLRDVSRKNKSDGWEQVAAIPKNTTIINIDSGIYMTQTAADLRYVQYQTATVKPAQTIYGDINIIGNVTATGEVSAFTASAPTDWWDSMPYATTTTVGGIIVGDNLTITDGVLDATGGVSNYPIGSGIAIVAGGAAWGTTITDNSTNWNTAYSDRLKWDGGATGLTAATGRASLNVADIGGSPLNTYLTRWSDLNTITGDDKMTWDGSTLNITGNIVATGEVTAFVDGVDLGSVNIPPTTVPEIANVFTIDLADNNNFLLNPDGEFSIVVTIGSSNIGQTGMITIINSSATTPANLPANLLTPNGAEPAWVTTSGNIAILSYYVISSTQAIVNYVGTFA